MKTPILLALAVGCVGGSASALAYQIYDQRVFAFGDYSYENLEISMDYRYAVLSRKDMSTGSRYVILYTVDNATGDLQQKCIYGVPVSAYAWAEWGSSSATGNFAVALDHDRSNFIVVNPDERDCGNVFQLLLIKYPAVLGAQEGLGVSLVHPLKGLSRRWVGFDWDNQWLPSGNGNQETVLFQDVDDSTHDAVHTEISTIPTGHQPANVVVTPRSRGPSQRNTRREVFYGRWDIENDRVNTYRRPFNDSGLGAETLVIDTVTANDAYPFAFGHVYLLSGNDNSADGALHIFAGGNYNTIAATIPYDPSQTTFPPPPEGKPSFAQSFQTFTWKSHLYAAYQVSNTAVHGPDCDGLPSCLATEIWMVRFDTSDIDNLVVDRQCRITSIVGDAQPAPDPYRFLSLMDPEALVLGSTAMIYYTRTNIDTHDAEEWRVKLGDEEQFAAACADPATLVIVEDPPE